MYGLDAVLCCIFTCVSVTFMRAFVAFACVHNDNFSPDMSMSILHVCVYVFDKHSMRVRVSIIHKMNSIIAFDLFLNCNWNGSFKMSGRMPNTCHTFQEYMRAKVYMCQK